jgi:hypothetical protein
MVVSPASEKTIAASTPNMVTSAPNSGVVTKVLNRLLLPHSSVFGQNPASLTHEPNRGSVNRLPCYGFKLSSFLNILQRNDGKGENKKAALLRQLF